MADLPVNPMSIALTVSHRMLWWQTMDEDDNPAHWRVSADVDPQACCPVEYRHVGDCSLLVADLDPTRNMLDSVELDEWDLEFIGETVLDLADGTLVPALDQQIVEGPPQMVILTHFELAAPWRGHGLAAPLIAATLARFAPTARLAVCRISPARFLAQHADRLAAELASVRLGALLERIGFFLWRDVYVVDLRNDDLTDAGLALLQRWVPQDDQRPESA
ncbi:hypothetical protein E1262_27155 [Jiangella aurantiaca]|uniref:N-acetyltransferase n=1 Tax=Jiangella aurantiaca TaxID=2530373 RepID=A0A4R5A1G4_9ACTN|nr:hypothetical protein [Jiangella aurantiaca]TDD64770.1 hypothetical protein E1262_27155 [Jiangella aurantiaca]